MEIRQDTIVWLLEGVPAIRWQAMRDLLESKQELDGCWRLGSRHTGKAYFVMDEAGKPSR